jgi:hypothetical protein
MVDDTLDRRWNELREFRSRDPGEISRRLVCSSCYYPERFRLIFRWVSGHLSLLCTRLPCKGYHDASPIRSRRMDAVPREIIVSTVLFWHTIVSLLDRRVRFDYPERASVEVLLQKHELRAFMQKSTARVSFFQLREWVSLLEFRIGNHTASRPLGIILCTSAATIVGFVTSEVTW